MFVLVAVERAVEVVVGAVGGFAVARGPVSDRGVDGFGVDDGADAVVKVEAAGAGQAGDFVGEGTGRERAGGDDPDGVGGDGGDFVAVEFDERLGGDGGGDLFGEEVAIDCESVPAGDAGFLGGLE